MKKIVLRLLDSSAANLDIDILGYSEQQKALYLNALKTPTRHDSYDRAYR